MLELEQPRGLATLSTPWLGAGARISIMQLRKLSANTFFLDCKHIGEYMVFGSIVDSDYYAPPDRSDRS